MVLDSIKRVYLAGPIKGLNYDSAVNWRENFKSELEKIGIVGVSPMRAKEFLKNEKNLHEFYQNALATPRGIVARDRFDVMSCDAMLVNLLGAEKVSIGTMVEYGWADSYRKPIVTVMENGNVHEHGFIKELSSYIVGDLDSGLKIIESILNY